MLNFTTGTYLKSLCERTYDLMTQNPEQVRAEILPLVDRHLKKINRDSTGYWGITDNNKHYSKKLKKLRRFIRKGSTDDIKTLAEETAAATREKIKIVFLTQETTCWPTLESFYIACKQDERYITDLVYTPFAHPNADNSVDYLIVYREEMKLPIANYDEYALSQESPDIAVFVKPYPVIPMQYHFGEIEKAVTRSILINYAFDMATWNTYSPFRYPLHYKAWRFVVYGERIRKLAEQLSYNNGRNTVAWGNPRADGYRNLKLSREKTPEEWKKKIHNRKTILWNTHHRLWFNYGPGSFFVRKDEVFSFFDNNPDIVLIWRPHPHLFGVLVNNWLMTTAELNHLVETANKKENVIIDLSPDYRDSFYVSDALITDGTSFLIEYLYTGRPLIYTLKAGGDTQFHDELCENLYVARTDGDVERFLTGIKNGEDPLREKRRSFAEKLLTVHPEGNGEYIKEQVYAEIIRECRYQGI